MDIFRIFDEDEFFSKEFRKKFKRGKAKGEFRFQPIVGKNVRGYIATWSYSYSSANPIEKEMGIREEKEGKDVLIDVRDEGSYIKIIAHMPGCTKNDIDINAEEDRITIKTKDFEKTIDLKEKIVPEKTRARYRNGVLVIEALKA